MISLEETKLSQVPEEAQSQMPTMHGQSLSCLSFTVLATRSPHPKVDMMEGGHEPTDLVVRVDPVQGTLLALFSCCTPCFFRFHMFLGHRFHALQ